MDPLALRIRLQAIVEIEIPQFAANVRPSQLPIIDMAESSSAQATSTSLDISKDLSQSNVTGLRKLSSDLTREIKALEKVLVPKFASHPAVVLTPTRGAPTMHDATRRTTSHTVSSYSIPRPRPVRTLPQSLSQPILHTFWQCGPRL
jgi:hypothetical protein